jgi:hypothetical protein
MRVKCVCSVLLSHARARRCNTKQQYMKLCVETNSYMQDCLSKQLNVFRRGTSSTLLTANGLCVSWVRVKHFAEENKCELQQQPQLLQ